MSEMTPHQKNELDRHITGNWGEDQLGDDAPRCCYIGPVTQSGRYVAHGEQCEANAEWTITFGPGPDDYTEACTAHVGDMLVPDVGNIVLQMEERP